MSSLEEGTKSITNTLINRYYDQILQTYFLHILLKINFLLLFALLFLVLHLLFFVENFITEKLFFKNFVLEVNTVSSVAKKIP